MKRFAALFCLVITNLLLPAQDNILVEAKFVEFPANQTFTTADLAGNAFAKKPGVDFLSSPRVLTASGQAATLNVGNAHKVPDAERGGQRNLASGIELKILPTADGGNVKYAAAVTIRQPEAAQKTTEVKVTEFSTRECFLEGVAKPGEPIFITCKGIHKDRKVAIALTFAIEPRR